MQIYIVRIYHRGRKDSKMVTGVVEEIGKEGKKAFIDHYSLWKILSTPSPKSMTTKRGPPKGKNRKDSREKSLTFTEILKSLTDEEE